MEDPEVTPVLRGLVRASARPLTVVEEHFAIDGTGFSTKVYKRWYDAKYGREMKEARWVKLHAVCGVRSKIITAAEVTDANVHDSPLLPQLIQETAEDFRMTEVSADKGYLSRANVSAIAEIGAEPFVAFKLNSTGKGPDAWQQAYHLFSFHKETWLAKYHKRSSIEATFGSLKRLLGGSVRARTEVAMKNEVLVKCVVYNATRLVHALHELGVDPMATLMMNREAS